MLDEPVYFVHVAAIDFVGVAAEVVSVVVVDAAAVDSDEFVAAAGYAAEAASAGVAAEVDAANFAAEVVAAPVTAFHTDLLLN